MSILNYFLDIQLSAVEKRIDEYVSVRLYASSIKLS